MSYTFNRIVGLNIELSPCPFCGGTAEWVEVPGNDFVMRCSKCHASTPNVRQTPEEAAADWNAHDVFDDHFTITSDTKIDKYLKPGIKKVLFSEYSNIENFPQFEDGFLCSGAVIITENIMLVLERDNSHLLYDKISGYGDIYKKPIAPEGTEIRFVRSRWRERSLLSLEFKCGDTQIIVASQADQECMVVREAEIAEQAEANRDKQRLAVRRSWKYHKNT